MKTIIGNENQLNAQKLFAALHKRENVTTNENHLLTIVQIIDVRRNIHQTWKICGRPQFLGKNLNSKSNQPRRWKIYAIRPIVQMNEFIF